MTALGQFQEGVALYDSANEARDTHRYDEALAQYAEALKRLDTASAPLRICLQYDLALCHDFAENAELAAGGFEKVIDLYKTLCEDAPADPAVTNLKNIVDGCAEQLALRADKHPRAEHYTSSITPRLFKSGDLPLKLFIDTSEYTGYDQDLTEVIIHAFDLWIRGMENTSRELRLGQALTYQLCDEADEANIKVHRVGPADATTSSAGAAGIGTARMRGQLPATYGGQTTYQQSVRARQATVWAYLGSYSNDKLTDKERRVFQSLIVHEAGHALGLDGHSPFGTDLMYWKSQLSAPTARDLKTLLLAYL